MRASVSPLKKFARSFSAALVLGFVLASSGVLLAAPANAAAQISDGLTTDDLRVRFPPIEGRWSPYWVNPATGIRYQVNPVTGDTWMRAKGSFPTVPGVPSGHASLPTSKPVVTIDDKFAEMVDKKNFKVNGKEGDLNGGGDPNSPPLVPAEGSTADKKSGVGMFLKALAFWEIAPRVAAGVPAVISCSTHFGECMSSDNVLDYAMDKAYPWGAWEKFKVENGWETSAGMTAFKSTPWSTDSMGNVFVPHVVESAYAGSGEYAGWLFLNGVWEGPAMSYPQGVEPYPLAFYEIQCTYTDAAGHEVIAWGPQKVRPTVPSGWQWSGGPNSAGYFMTSACATAGIDMGENKSFRVTGARGYKETYGADGVTIVPADPGNKHKPLNTFGWSETMIGEDGSVAEDMTQFIVQQECQDGSGNVTKIDGRSYGDARSLVVPSCAAHGAGLTSQKATVFADIGKGPMPMMTVTPGAEDVPGCTLADRRAGAAACSLAVELDGTVCVAGSALCENWAEIAQATPERVKCLYGGQPAAMSDCNALERSYGLRPGQLNGPNTDGRPETGGHNYWEDNLGHSVPRPSNGTPSSDPASFLNMPPKQDLADCAGDAFKSFNMIVLSLGGCVLKAAFQPDPTNLASKMQALQAVSGDTPVGRIGQAIFINANTFGVALSGGAGSSGCSGPPLEFDIPMAHIDRTFYLFNACDDPIKTVAATVNMLISITFILAGGFSIARAYAMSFGYDLKFGRGFTEAKS